MNQGWIKVYRQIQDCEIWDNDKPFDERSAWIDLLLLVNHRDKNTLFDKKPITVSRGQRITSIRKLAERWNWSFKRTREYLILLEELHMITRESDNKKSLITIVNYDIYQDEGITEESQRNHKGITEESQKNHRRTTNKNEKNEENEKNEKNEKNIKLKFGEYQNVKLTQEEYDRLATDLGVTTRNECIRFLDEYIEEKGYKSKSHNLAIRRWVLDAVKKKEPKKDDFFSRLQQAVKEVEDVKC